MSTMGKEFRTAALATLSALAIASAWGVASAQDGAAGGGTVFGPMREVVQPLPGRSVPPPSPSANWDQARDRVSAAQAADPAISAVLAEWRRLQESEGWGFSTYARFMLANPGWPGEDRFREVAERAINPSAYDPAEVIAYFSRFPPQTATGMARQAMALAAAGRMDEARMTARSAWVSGAISADDEQRILSAHAGALTADDHLLHADQALWAGQPESAERVLAWLPPTRRAVIEARIAMQRRAPDTGQRIAAADPVGVMDAGYLYDKARWLRAAGDSAGARNLLASRGRLSAPAGNPDKWFALLLSSAREAVSDSDSRTAFNIASKLDDAYPVGTDISDKPFRVRDTFTSLAWLAGTAALNRLDRPGDAIAMFRHYSEGARQPQTIAKGLYWAGRAAALANSHRQAEDYFRKASAYPDQYYGQLSLERLGLPVAMPGTLGRPVELSASVRAEFANRSIVRAVRYLGATGQWQDQSRLLRAIAANAVSDQDHFLAVELSQSISRPDLGVMVGRRALANGLTGYADASFPRVSVPDDQAYNWTMIHAIARQESQFDRQIVSRAGARGLMQLMPGTARQVAGGIGLAYQPAALDDPHYNITLGSTYFQQMLRYYDGSYPLAVAAYNAGPGNVNKWIRANGDPRQPGVDIVQWIEDIPIYETRNYVQRVLENAVVYDLLNPGRQSSRIAAPLSRYLGKDRPG
jgi:soluble lytic murein transglycosylase